MCTTSTTAKGLRGNPLSCSPFASPGTMQRLGHRRRYAPLLDGVESVNGRRPEARTAVGFSHGFRSSRCADLAKSRAVAGSEDAVLVARESVAEGHLDGALPGSRPGAAALQRGQKPDHLLEDGSDLGPGEVAGDDLLREQIRQVAQPAARLIGERFVVWMADVDLPAVLDGSRPPALKRLVDLLGLGDSGVGRPRASLGDHRDVRGGDCPLFARGCFEAYRGLAGARSPSSNRIALGRTELHWSLAGPSERNIVDDAATLGVESARSHHPFLAYRQFEPLGKNPRFRQRTWRKELGLWGRLVFFGWVRRGERLAGSAL